MRNLVIGNTSQVSYYFPDDYVKIPSRDIDFDFIKSENWNRIFLCFGESRKFIDDISLYDDVNFHYTIEVVNKIKDFAINVIVYSTCELWNGIDGKVDLSMNFNFYNTPYISSKYKLSNYILNNNSDFHNVIILYPFNFNSIYRNNNFLFGKIFYSIINKVSIEIGDTYFYRDIIHPKYVVDRSINAKTHEIIGSGRLTFVNDFIRDLYVYYEMDYSEYVIENISKYNEYDKKKEYYLNSNKSLYSYERLLDDTIKDIKNNLII